MRLQSIVRGGESRGAVEFLLRILLTGFWRGLAGDGEIEDRVRIAARGLATMRRLAAGTIAELFLA